MVIDEADIDFATEHSWIEEIKNYPNVIVTQTLSKAVRFSRNWFQEFYMFLKKLWMDILIKLRPPYNMNQLTQLKAIEILSDYDKVIAVTNTIIQTKKF